MFDKDAILYQVQAGQVPSSWRVVRPQTSHFTKALLLYLILICLFAGGILYMNSAHIVYVPGYGSDPLSDSDYNTWRIIDYVVIGLFILGMLFGAVQNILDMLSAKEQLLILMPEGFIRKLRSSTQAINYAEVASIGVKVYRSTTTLIIKNIAGGKESKVAFDGRFGNNKQIAEAIITTQRSYANANRQSPAI